MPILQPITFNKNTFTKCNTYTYNSKETKISVTKEQINKNKNKNFIFYIDTISKNIFDVLVKILNNKGFTKIVLYFNYNEFVYTEPQQLSECVKMLYDVEEVNVLFVFDRSLVAEYVPIYELRLY
ncbi:hypothetical protein CDIK_4087 [Cucumispora dikerogammari]|nr:hypothetical protein CDIK_4087 [Cucumispora dikerogammari]